MKKIIFFIIVLISYLSILSPVVFAESETGVALTVHFIDVEEGDCTFMELPNKDNILVDAGSPSAGYRVVQYLKSLGIDEIDHFILTHPHDDHIGGVFSVLANFKVENIYDNGFSNFKSILFPDYVKAVRSDLTKYQILQAGEKILSDAVTIEVLNPLLPPTGHLNNDSIVLKLTHGDIKFLLAGDMGNIGEKRLLKINEDLKSQILKIAHHGENDANLLEYLDAVDPETGIISVSMINKYARPNQKVLDRLSENNIKIYRTDISGDIVIRSDGKTYSVTVDPVKRPASFKFK